MNARETVKNYILNCKHYKVSPEMIFGSNERTCAFAVKNLENYQPMNQEMVVRDDVRYELLAEREGYCLTVSELLDQVSLDDSEEDHVVFIEGRFFDYRILSRSMLALGLQREAVKAFVDKVFDVQSLVLCGNGWWFALAPLAMHPKPPHYIRLHRNQNRKK